MMMKKTLGELFREGQHQLEAASKESSAFDARALLSFVTGIPFSQMPVRYGNEAADDQAAEFEELIERRINGEPLQYITGEQDFMGLTFHVDERVLIPRLDTEILAEKAIKYINGELTKHENSFRVLDLCSGSGAIGLSIAALAGSDKSVSLIGDESGIAMHTAAAKLNVVLADISADALDVSRQNAEALGVSDKVSFVKSDLFENVQGNYDLVVSNPPYVRSDVIPTLEEEVRGHEPMLALDGGDDGLDIYRRIADEAPDHLKSGGCLMMEIGFDQAEDIISLFESSDGRSKVVIIKDLAGLDRVAVIHFD